MPLHTMKGLFLIAVSLAAVSAAPSEVLRGFTLSNNQFTADVYKEYKASAEKNFVVCPLSVEILLALIHAGAGGKTADELSKSLRLPQKRDAIDEIYRELHPNLQANEKYTLQSANKIYVKEGYSLTEQYKNTAVEVFGASAESIDFNQKQAAVNTINSWVDENTHHKINKLIEERNIDQDTRAVLLNAIYFKGKWEKAFKHHHTKKKPFYLTEKSFVEVDMMEQTNYFRYFKSPSLKAKFVELPYEGDNITMTIVLPDGKEELSALEEQIHEVVVEPEYTWHRVHLRLPKNKIETFVELNSILEKLGINEAFTPAANFQQMINATNEPLFISKVIQKALIETDEEGTVATAVTGGIMVTRLSAPLPPPKPINFNVNHPFIFFLKHKSAGIMFIGRYSTPEGEVHVVENKIDKENEE